MMGFLAGFVAAILLATATYITIDSAAISVIDRTADGDSSIVVGEMDGHW